MYRPFRLTSSVLNILIAMLMSVTALSAQAQGANEGCYQTTRLKGAGPVRVVAWPNVPNNIRAVASLSGRIVGTVPVGQIATIPQGEGTLYCGEGIHWVYINYNGVEGWTAEGDGHTQYWLEPVLSSSTKPIVYCFLMPRLTRGNQGRVKPGLPNVIRSSPIITGTTSTILGGIPAGATFDVLYGPECGSDGRLWWSISYSGTIGWTAEGESNSYWLEPLSGSPTPPTFYCPLLPRLTVGTQGRVKPGLPNVIRSAPIFTGMTSTILGEIPAGATFDILSGPACGTDGRLWWRISYKGSIGWTAEGEGKTYWLEPIG